MALGKTITENFFSHPASPYVARVRYENGGFDSAAVMKRNEPETIVATFTTSNDFRAFIGVLHEAYKNAFNRTPLSPYDRTIAGEISGEVEVTK